MLRVEVRFELFPGLSMALAQREGRGSPRSPLTDILADELQLEGEFESTTLVTTALLAPNFEAGFSLAWWSMEHEGGLFWGGQRYGRLNALRGDGEDLVWSLRWRQSNDMIVLLQTKARRMSAFGRGRVESWPFTETAIDLLGLRQIATAELDLSILSFGIGIDWSPGSHDFGLGFAHHAIALDGFLETWVPGPLGIGRSQFVHRDTDIDRIGVDEIRFRSSRRFGRYELFWDLRQIVAMNFHAPPSSPGDDPHEDRPPTSPSARGWWGGLFLATALQVSF